MRSELCIAKPALSELQLRLLASDVEECAILLASLAKRRGGSARLLVREVIYPSADLYQDQSSISAQLTPDFVAQVAKKAKLKGLQLIFVHTHPGGLSPVFSRVDDEGEKALRQFLDVRGVPGLHGALVLSDNGLRCRELGAGAEMRLVTLGDKRVLEFDPDADVSVSPQACDEIFDRQVRAFGSEGQRRLQGLRVAIVGLGGTGSIVAQQLVHLGVKDFVLIDPDTIEITNLNRVVGATAADVGRSKVDVAKRYLEAFRPEVTVACFEGNVVHDNFARELVDADLILGCTDSHGSRSVIQQVAYQYMIPCIDMGSTITQSNGRITGIFGRIQALSVGFPCLWCSHLLDSAEVRRDMASDVERQLDPYIVGGGEPAPSVISLNGTVVSLAVSMVLGFFTDAPIAARHLIYNATASTLRSVKSSASSNCFICSPDGALGWGDVRKLFTRQD